MSEIERKVIEKGITYPGIKNPRSLLEIKVEICGLRNAIKIAEELISRHEQVLALLELEEEALKNALQKESTNTFKTGEG